MNITETTLKKFVKTIEMRLKTMKLHETTIRQIFMILSFLFAGIALLFFLFFLIGFINNGNLLGFSRFLNPHAEVNNPLKYVYLGIAVFSGMGAVLSLASGILLLRTSHQKFHESVKEKVEEEFQNSVQGDILLPDEKKLILILEKNNDSMTQSDLVRESALSKVKVHRVLKNLEAKKIVTKYDFGMTKRIRLEKKVKEEEKSS